MLRIDWEEALLEDLSLLGGFIDQLVGGIVEWGKGVELAAFSCLG